jgi:DNA mismatch repair protein MutL
MNKMRCLTSEEINQISAGEVILEPMSVVKELLDNAVDSCASQINITIEEDGEQLIEVEDNGCGIASEELAICTQRYVTSKFIDLYNIRTLGFRGEALHSIQCVSSLTIRSNQQMYHNGVISAAATNEGTVVAVRNLFYNLPVRRKWLQRQRKNNKIETLIQAYVIAFPNIGFSLSYNGKKQTFYNNALEIIFKDVYNTKINFYGENDRFKISGTIFVGAKYKQFIILNNRVLEDRKLTAQVRDSYQTISGYSSVSFVLQIECDVSLYDVNIHPCKNEVHFYDDSIFALMDQSIKNACYGWRVPFMRNRTEVPDNWIFNQEELKEVAHMSNRYIVYIYDNKISIVDQHAAHERILFHELQSNIGVSKQRMLQPLKFTLYTEQIQLWYTCVMLTKLFDFTLDNYDLSIYSVCNLVNVATVNEIVKNSYSENDILSVLNHTLHEHGCHHAIKSGCKLTKPDATQLLNKLLATPNHAICNHGRPTIIHFSLQQLNNMFCRK